MIRTAGLWLHCDGWATPHFNSDGYVLGTDSANTMISDLSRFLDVARTNNILVFIVLWNGAVTPQTNLLNLLWDESKLQTYIDRALVPMVAALKDKVAIGGWEIMNEVSFSSSVDKLINLCTTHTVFKSDMSFDRPKLYPLPLIEVLFNIDCRMSGLLFGAGIAMTIS